MSYNQINKYISAGTSGRSTRELMILVLEKAENHMKAAKEALINDDFLERGKNIYTVTKIMEGLSKTVTVKDEVPGSDQVLKIYETMGYAIEKLIADKSPPEEYDYFIEYISELKKMWLEHEEESGSTSNSYDQIYISEEKENDAEEDSFYFDREGKFEIVT